MSGRVLHVDSQPSEGSSGGRLNPALYAGTRTATALSRRFCEQELNGIWSSNHVSLLPWLRRPRAHLPLTRSYWPTPCWIGSDFFFGLLRSSLITDIFFYGVYSQERAKSTMNSKISFRYRHLRPIMRENLRKVRCRPWWVSRHYAFFPTFQMHKTL